jgi:hypothetical protein
MLFLKQSTAVIVKLGPFLDETNGKDAETGLTISQADIRLSKNGGAYAQSHNAAGATHDEKGNYGVPLDTTDTGTLGTLRVHIHESGALPVWQDFMVVPANVWDSLFASDKLQVHAAEISNGLITADAIATDAISAAKIAANAIGSSEFAQAAADKVWSTAARALTDKAGFTISGTKQTLDALNDLSAADVNAQVDSALDTAIPGSPTAHSINERIKALDTLLESGGSGDAAAIKAKTDNLPADPADDSDIDSQLATIDGNIDTLITRIPAEVAQKQHLVNGTGDITPPSNKGIWDALGDGTKAISGLNDLSAADVNAECDTALSDYDAVVPADLPTNFADLAITVTTGKVTVGTNDDKTGYGLSAAAIDAIWDEVIETAHEDDGSAGEHLNALAKDILARTNTQTLNGLLGVADSAGKDVPRQVWDETEGKTGDTHSFETVITRLYRFLMNKMNITDASGAVALRNETDSGSIATQTITDDDTTTTRTALNWS